MSDPQEDLGVKLWGRALHDASDTLIKRGTAMGPLTLLLLLVPVFVTAAWLFRDTVAVMAVFVLSSIAIPIVYATEFGRFARRDPDRLQSEHYRYEMTKIQMIAAKELPFPVPVDSLPLASATTNPTLPTPTLPAAPLTEVDS